MRSASPPQRRWQKVVSLLAENAGPSKWAIGLLHQSIIFFRHIIVFGAGTFFAELIMHGDSSLISDVCS